MSQEIFADTVSNINVTGQIVRIDLATLQPQLKSDNGQPVFANSQRIVMPLEGFLQAVGVQQNIVQQLVNSGIVKMNAAPSVGQEQPGGMDKDAAGKTEQ